ncbi:MAG: hypothetical protein EOP11_10655 [Proteobacteria bacterium]|nr:MAG: hypothetical protein EOP11_10655 [Pseudomonadota bacterium]
MKFLSLGLLLLSANAFASPAVSYSCVGKNSVTKEAVTFEVLFAESDLELGYTNQAITVTKQGWETSPVTFQMYGATKANACQKNESGELYHSAGFKMDSVKKGSLGDFTMSFRANCGERLDFNVKGVCFFDLGN